MMLVTIITSVWCKFHQHLEGHSNEERNGEDESEGAGNSDDVDRTVILHCMVHWGLNTAAGKIWTHKRGNVMGYSSKSKLLI